MSASPTPSVALLVARRDALIASLAEWEVVATTRDRLAKLDRQTAWLGDPANGRDPLFDGRARKHRATLAEHALAADAWIAALRDLEGVYDQIAAIESQPVLAGPAMSQPALLPGGWIR